LSDFKTYLLNFLEIFERKAQAEGYLAELEGREESADQIIDLDNHKKLLKSLNQQLKEELAEYKNNRTSELLGTFKSFFNEKYKSTQLLLDNFKDNYI
jgi:hypothetical protein